MKKRGLSLILVLLAATACEREQRQFQVPPPQASKPEVERTRHEENAYSVSQGKLLYQWFNCIGCHAQGGGGMGPAHMDAKWRYGSDPKSIYATIMEGRPNGMPGFRGRISEDQAWQLVAYVRSMSALISKDVRPGRSDSLSSPEPEVMRDKP
ncbi:MAG TPA: c-type cytochrome [Burkholderiales bacterium]|nr:c-type cytochrome [Burkholderiales bacterium]